MCQLETLEMSLLIAIDSPKWINYEHNKSESLIKSHSPSKHALIYTQKIIYKTFIQKLTNQLKWDELSAVSWLSWLFSFNFILRCDQSLIFNILQQIYWMKKQKQSVESCGNLIDSYR